MTSQARIEANRRNARLSTGPRSPDGKARAALNALKHGLHARTIVLPGEDEEKFAALRDDFLARWRPNGALEDHLVDRLVGLFWRQDRVARAEAGLLASALAPGDGEAGDADADPFAMWDRLGRIETRLALAFERTLARLRDLQERRRYAEARTAREAKREAERDAEAPTAAERHKSQLQALAQQRRELREIGRQLDAREAARRHAGRAQPPAAAALLSGASATALMAATGPAPNPGGQ